MSPGIAGYIFANISLELPFEIGAALQALNAILFYVFFHDLRPPEERATPADEPEANPLAEAETAPRAARLV